MFKGRVMGVGSIEPGGRSPYDDVLDNRARAYNDVGSIAVCHPDSPPGTCKPANWNPNELAIESEKAIKEAQSWRSNTPIASWTSANASGVARTINVYGYNKEIGYVWLAEGPSSSAANSQLFPEFVLAAKSPEWVAAKASLGSSSGGGSALPLLLGAAYLLLS
jgi:hypothetical protein